MTFLRDSKAYITRSAPKALLFFVPFINIFGAVCSSFIHLTCDYKYFGAIPPLVYSIVHFITPLFSTIRNFVMRKGAKQSRARLPHPVEKRHSMAGMC